jgi:DNA-binding PadR family transcriptional regulator
MFPIGMSGQSSSSRAGSVKWLPASSYVVLGLLSFGRDLTGYELKHWAHDSIRFFWSEPSMSQVYRELARLEGLGLVRARDESGEAERPRTTYHLTASGRRALVRWVEEAPVDEPVLQHGPAFRLFLGHLARPERLREVLLEHERRMEALLDDLRRVRAELEDDPVTWPDALGVARWGEAIYGADLRGTRRLLGAEPRTAAHDGQARH